MAHGEEVGKNEKDPTRPAGQFRHRDIEEEMMDIIKSIETEQLKDKLDDFNVGDNVKVHFKIIEGKTERIQIYEGTVLQIKNGGLRRTFTVRKISYGVGVERVFPLHSPRVEKIEVVRNGKVRRAKLYYLRDRVGKSAKVKELIRKKVVKAPKAD